MAISSGRKARLTQLHSLIENANGRLTVPGLAKSLEVSERTIHYDLRVLMQSGTPLLIHTGRNGGVELATTSLTNHESRDQPQSDEDQITVGYSAELRLARNIVEGLRSGVPEILVVTGEAGSGKTHFSSHVSRFAERSVFRSVTAHAAPSAPAFWPFSQIAEILASGRSESDSINVLLETVASSVPELRHLVRGSQSAVNSTGADSEADRYRLLQSFSNLLRSVSGTSPLLVRLEDAHWADQSTLDLLGFLGNQHFNNPVLILVTVRTREIETRDVSSKLLASLARSESSRRIDLNGLNREETGQLIELVAGGTQSAEMIESLFGMTGGNPLFITEYGRLLKNGGPYPEVSVPDVVREVLDRRISQLSTSCQSMLEAASVLGQYFGRNQLSSIVDECDADLEEARLAGILEVSGSSPDQFAFAHALVRDAVLTGMPLTRRRYLNLEAASSLQAAGQAGEFSKVQLAGFLMGAGDLAEPEHVAMACLEAAEATMRGHAYTDAIRWFEHALRLLGDRSDHVVARVCDGLARCKIGSHVGSAVQNNDEATDLCLRAFNLHVKLGDTDAAVRLALLPGADNPRLQDKMIELATGLARDGSPERALLESKRGMRLAEPTHRKLDPSLPIEAIDSSDRAIGIAEDLDDDYVRMWAYQRRAYIHYNYIGWDTSVPHSKRAFESASAIDDPRGIAISGSYLAKGYAATGRLDDALSVSRLAVDAAIRNRTPHGQWPAYGTLATSLMMRGAFDQLNEPLEWWKSHLSNSEPAHAAKAYLSAWTGNRDGILEFVQRIADSAVPTNPLRAAFLGWSVCMLARDSFDESVKEIAVDSSGRFLSIEPTPNTSRFFSWAAGEGARTVLDQDQQAALPAYERLISYRSMAEPGFWSHFCLIDPLLGELAILQGNYDTAAEHFEEALQFCRNGNYYPDLARTCLLYARSQIESPAHVDAYVTRKLLEEGEKVAEQNHLTTILRVIRDLRLEFDKRVRSGDLRPSGLTRTEVRVLKLVAEGLSNQEIADSLVVSRHTVNTHVSSILRKTDSASRSQAIGFARQSGIA